MLEGMFLKTIGITFLIAMSFVLVFIVFGVYTFFHGNPISQYKFKKDANHYLEATYPKMESHITNVEYNFKTSTMSHHDYMAHFYFILNKKELYYVFINDNGVMTDSSIYDQE